jgi:hypothetical protein
MWCDCKNDLHKFLSETQNHAGVKLQRGLKMDGTSEWASDCYYNANSAMLKLYHGENKLILNEMMIRSALH